MLFALDPEIAVAGTMTETAEVVVAVVVLAMLDPEVGIVDAILPNLILTRLVIRSRLPDTMEVGVQVLALQSAMEGSEQGHAILHSLHPKVQKKEAVPMSSRTLSAVPVLPTPYVSHGHMYSHCCSFDVPAQVDQVLSAPVVAQGSHCDCYNQSAVAGVVNEGLYCRLKPAR